MSLARLIWLVLTLLTIRQEKSFRGLVRKIVVIWITAIIIVVSYRESRRLPKYCWPLLVLYPLETVEEFSLA